MTDDPAAEEFCRRMWPRLVGTMTLVCGDRATGEDLAQEALARAWARWSHVREADSPDAWVFRVALNLSTSRFRRLAAERRALRRTATPVDAHADAAEAAALRDAVSRLPERQRRVIALRYFADLSVDETARVMRCAPGTVKSNTSHAISRLRTDLQVALDVTVELDA